MANFIKFFDTVQFQAVDKSEVLKNNDNFGTQNIPGSPLVVKIAATHSGLITRNNGFYLPDRMRKGAASFTAHYGKPIQTHHNDGADPVGRVIKAEYVDISANVQDKFLSKVLNRSQNRFGDQFVKDFMGGNVPYIQSVNFIVDSLNHKDSVLDDPDYKGLGYILLTASIADPEAKQKILDGRYLTGSVGVTTNHAVCSVCKQDWTGDDGRCEHKPGRVYDGAKAFIITGDLTYDEYSFVNVPADRHSGILQVNVDGITDSVTMENSVGRPISVNLFKDSIDVGQSTGTINVSQEEPMSKVAELVSTLKVKFELVDEASVEAITKSFDGVDIETLDEVELATDVEAKLDRESFGKIFAVQDAAERMIALKKLRPFAEETGLAELPFTDKTADEAYDALNTLEWNDYSEAEDEALVAYLAEHPEDSKLSGAQRKRLPGSTFCGPNKSFPVPDTSHIASVRKLVGKASVSAATKAKILANVSRKASAMSYDASKDSVVENTPAETTIVTTPEATVVEDTATCASCETLKDSVAKLEASVAELTDKLEKAVSNATAEADALKKDNAKVTKDLDATRTELKLTHEDLTQMADQLVALQEEQVKLIADKVFVFKQLSGESLEDATKSFEELATLGKDAVLDKLKEVILKVDMKKITDSINSGLTRVPTGTVNDPSGKLEDAKKVYTKENVAAVAQQYQKLLFSQGQIVADRFKREMQNKGIIPTG